MTNFHSDMKAFDLVTAMVEFLKDEPLLTPQDKLELFKEKSPVLNKLIETFELEIA